MRQAVKAVEDGLGWHRVPAAYSGQRRHYRRKQDHGPDTEAPAAHRAARARYDHAILHSTRRSTPIAMTSSVYDITVNRIDGSPATLADYRGKVLLVVNVASKCGLTPQYEGLEKLYRAKHDQGLEVLGFPANDFGAQEPGSDAEISEFCTLKFDVHFPLFSKISVLGPAKHPLYASLVAAQPAAIGEGPFRERLKGYGIAPTDKTEVLWNFEKFLVGRDGKVLARFAPDTGADDPRLLEAIEAALAA
jgi:glutathione peroxidase